jgi:lipoprotein-releasing system permease protein
VKDVLKSEEIARKISAILDFPYWARDWTKANQNIFSSIRLQKTVMFIILTLIVLVAGFSITSSLMMMVMEKTKDISILMAMGASRRSIRKIFIFKGMVIGLTGTSLGMILGFGLCALLAWYPIIELPEDIYYFSRLPVHLTGVDVLIITASALLICFISTIYPAQKASRLVPVEGIRKGM